MPDFAQAPRCRFFSSQTLTLHYAEWGHRDAPPVILVHGGLDHCRNWDFHAELLANHFRVIAPDLRGHGDSAWSTDGHYSTSDYVYDLADLIEQLQLETIRLVGHSLGGFIALRFAAIYPVKVSHLAAIEGLGPAPHKQQQRDEIPVDERWREWIMKRRAAEARLQKSYSSIDEACQRMQEKNVHLSVGLAYHLTQHGLRNNEDGSYSWKFDNRARVTPPIDVSTEQMHLLWSKISCPTLLIYGAKSWASNPAKDGRVEYFQNAEVMLVEDAGHWVHHDQPNLFAERLARFLA